MENRATSSVEVLDVPLQEIGLCERWRLRDTDWEWVRRLAEETDPNDWDALWVRRWPEQQPRPAEYPQAKYDVASGWHRTLAAHQKHLPTIRVEVYDAPDDAGMLLLAYRGNARHGKPMGEEDKRALVRRLAELGKSQAAIAKETGIPKSTVSAWLSGRDTNASKKATVVAAPPMRTEDTAASSTRQTGGATGLAAASTSRPDADTGPLGTRDVTQVSVAVNRVLAANLPGLRVAAVQAWIATLDEIERARYRKAFGGLAAWANAFIREAEHPGYTPEDLAERQRDAGISMNDILNMLFGEGAGEGSEDGISAVLGMLTGHQHQQQQPQ